MASTPPGRIETINCFGRRFSVAIDFAADGKPLSVLVTAVETPAQPATPRARTRLAQLSLQLTGYLVAGLTPDEIARLSGPLGKAVAAKVHETWRQSLN